MSKDTGGSAFPKQPIVHLPGLGELVTLQDGMTLRDYFAAKALQGLLANSRFLPTQFEPTDNASYVFRVADAMLAERDK